MNRIVFSNAAVLDLADIWEFSQENWGADKADEYITQIHSEIELLKMYPQRGKRCDYVKPGYRKLGVGRHVVFYKYSADSVFISRILHQRMDVFSHLQE